jgi:hypothetical protein
MQNLKRVENANFCNNFFTKVSKSSCISLVLVGAPNKGQASSQILPPSIYLLHLSNFFSKSLLRISLGPRIWLLVRVAHLVLIGYSMSAFIAPWLLISCDFLAAPCLKCKSALFTAPWSLRRRLIQWRLMDGGSNLVDI